MWLTTRSKLLSLGNLVPDDTADRCTGGSAQQAATTDDIAGDATDDGTGSGASLLVRHVGATAQNDQGCYCNHADRIVTYRFHFASFMLKNWLKGNQHPFKCGSGLAAARRCVLGVIAIPQAVLI
jgi:hypothetical protein